MIESIPDICDKCGSDDISTTVHRKNASSTQRIVNASCNDCGATLADSEKMKTRVNYKSPVKPDDE